MPVTVLQDYPISWQPEEDIYHIYDPGVNSFSTKPVAFDSLVDMMKTLGKYWFEIVELPPERIGD